MESLSLTLNTGKKVEKTKNKLLLIIITFLVLADQLKEETIKKILLSIPSQYREFAKVFSKIEAEKLLSYRPGINHKIIFRLSIILLFGSIYNLSETEFKVLKEYITKILKLGFI